MISACTTCHFLHYSVFAEPFRSPFNDRLGIAVLSLSNRNSAAARLGANCSRFLDSNRISNTETQEGEDGDDPPEAESKLHQDVESSTPLLRLPSPRIIRPKSRVDSGNNVARVQLTRSQTDSSSPSKSSLYGLAALNKRDIAKPGSPYDSSYRVRVNAFLKALRQAEIRQNGGSALFQTLNSFRFRLNDQDMCILLREAPHWKLSLKYWSWMKQQVNYRPNIFHYNTVIGLLGAAGRWDHAVSLAEQAQYEGLKLDAITFTLLIRNASGLGFHYAAVEWYERMRAWEVAGDEVSYRTAIKALGKAGRLGNALALFRDMPSLGVTPDATTGSVLLATCRGWGEDVEKQADEVVRASVSERGVVSRNHYYALMLIYREAKWPERVQHLYFEMCVERRLHPDAQLCGLVVEVLLESGLQAEAEMVFADMKRIYGRQMSLRIYKAMIGGSERWQRDSRRVELYEELTARRLKADLGIFNQMIAVSARGGTKWTVDEWLAAMQQQGLEPTLETYRSAIGGCKLGSRFQVAVDIFEKVQQSGLKYRDEVKLLRLLLSLLEKSTCWAEAEMVIACVKKTSESAFLLLSVGGFEPPSQYQRRLDQQGESGAGGTESDRREALLGKARRLVLDRSVFWSVVNVFWSIGLRQRARAVVRHSMRSGDLRRVRGLVSSSDHFWMPAGLPSGVCQVAVREWLFRLRRRYSGFEQNQGVEQDGLHTAGCGELVMSFEDGRAAEGLVELLLPELSTAGVPFRVEKGDLGEVQLRASRKEIEEWFKTESADVELRMGDSLKPGFEGWPHGVRAEQPQILDSG